MVIVAVQKLVNLTLEHPKFLSNYIFPSYDKVCNHNYQFFFRWFEFMLSKLH